jgi:hypothetical protein
MIEMHKKVKSTLQTLRDNENHIPTQFWRDVLWLQKNEKLGMRRDGSFIWKNNKKWQQRCTWKTFFLKKFHCWNEHEIVDIVSDYFLLIKLAKHKLTAHDIMKCKNAEIRRHLLMEYGYEKFVQELKGVVVHKADDSELIKLRWNKDEEPLKLVKVKDSTTGRIYIIRVPKNVKSCREAVAWTFGMGKEEYHPIKET